jgi:hypothetical protein
VLDNQGQASPEDHLSIRHLRKQALAETQQAIERASQTAYEESLFPDPPLEHMRAHGLPLSRESYLEFNDPDGVPDPFPAELEWGLPAIFRRPG